jgi:L-alanine-DL-glutamate epimerase-like enolase superfamily enzyme
MKITNITSYAVEIPLKPERRMISALGQHTVSRYVVVRIETDAGIDGVGEATVMPRWSGESVWGSKALIDQVFTPLLIGRNPHDLAENDALLDRAAVHNWFTKSAIEMACWDILGKEAGKPVYELLGGAVRDRSIRCRFSMGAYSPERARSRAQQLVEEGFTTIKVKVGTVPAEDIERVRIVRETIGPDCEIVIDANTGYDAATAIRVFDEIRSCNIALFEQPTPDGDYEALAAVRNAIRPTKVMADDMAFNLVHAKECIRNKAVDVISVYPGKNGGIRKCREIVEFAAQHGVACSMGSNLEWDIATAAMCHLVVACPNLRVEEFPGDILGPEYHEVRVVTDPLRIRGPFVELSDRPGLGVDVDWSLIERHKLLI